MTNPKIREIEVQGFRAFGQQKQTLKLTAPLAAVWGPNSQGKTSLAEAVEFLFTGQIVRRALMASSQDEFADALRNAHIPPGAAVYVEAKLTDTYGRDHTVRRTLLNDYGKKDECRTTLTINGQAACEADLVTLGIALSQPPLRAPVLVQHTLGYLFSARPQERATYFKALLEVTDLEVFRNAVAGLEASVKIEELDAFAKLRRATAIPEVTKPLARLQTKPPSRAEIETTLSDALAAVITGASDALPTGLSARIEKLRDTLAEKRAKTFPVKGFDKAPLPPWKPPSIEQWRN